LIPNGRRLVAVNAGSNAISPIEIDEDELRLMQPVVLYQGLAFDAMAVSMP